MFRYSSTTPVPALTAFEAIRRLLGEEQFLSTLALEALEAMHQPFGAFEVLVGYAKHLQDFRTFSVPNAPQVNQLELERPARPVVDLANLQVVHHTPAGSLRVCYSLAGWARLDFVPQHSRLEQVDDVTVLLIASLASDQNDIWMGCTVACPDMVEVLNRASEVLPEQQANLTKILRELHLLPKWEQQFTS